VDGDGVVVADDDADDDEDGEPLHVSLQYTCDVLAVTSAVALQVDS
jgi:hypothetical protein